MMGHFGINQQLRTIGFKFLTNHKTKHPKPLTNSGFFITSKSINNPKQEKTKWLKQMFMNSWAN
nr:MAG TPA: hypothetical protein [Caudoviricetes sp.]